MKRTLTFFAVICAMQLFAQAPFSTIDSIDVNNISAVALVHGDMWWKPHGVTGAVWANGCNFPKGKRNHIGFAAAMWLSGYDDGGNLHVSAQTYRQDGNDYWPGPLDGGGNLDYATSSDWARIWKVNRAEVTAHRNRDFRNTSNTPAAILEWPGKGNAYARGKDGAPLTVDREMAPFIDKNGDGIYQPLSGDYPDFKGDQALWWMFSDNGPSHDQSNGQPLKVEVQVMAYAYKRNTLIDNVVYYDYAITNRSSTDYHSVRWALFDDVAENYLPDPFAQYDSARRMGIFFKDNLAGAPIPHFSVVDTSISGVTLIQSPGDNGSDHMPAGGFVYFKNDPSTGGVPSAPNEYGNYMHAKMRDGSNFVYAGLPVSYFYWVAPMLVPPGMSECGLVANNLDRRFVLSSNDFSLNRWETKHVVLALVADSLGGTCPLPRFTGIKATADTAWAVYHNPPPEVVVHNLPSNEGGLQVFPNPASGAVVVRVGGSHDGYVSVHDVLGREWISARETNNGQATLDVSQCPPGIYVLRYMADDGTAASAAFRKE